MRVVDFCQLKCFFVGNSQVRTGTDLVQVLYYLYQLSVILVAEERNHGNPVGQMEGKGAHVIVDEEDFCEVEALENSQVLNAKALLLQESCVLLIKSVLNQLASGVQVVYYRVCIPIDRGGEDCNFIPQICLPQAIECKWSYRKAVFPPDPTFLLEINPHLWLEVIEAYGFFALVQVFPLDEAVDESLVEVEDDEFCRSRVS